VPETILERPPGLIIARIDPDTGLLARPDNPDAIFEVFRSRYAPTSMEQKSGSGAPSNEPFTPESSEHLF